MLITFGWCRESLLDLGEVQHHGQLVYLTTFCKLIGGHDWRDAQLLLQNAKGQLVVVNSVGLIQSGHVTVKK